MSIEINTGATKSVDWAQILAAIGEVQQTEGVDGNKSFTITTKGAEGTTTITVNIPDDLEIPENVDKGTLQGLVDKLSKSGINFSDEQIAQMKDVIASYYDEMVGAINNADSASGSKKKSNNAMFNLYALMALMIEVAQSQRDAQREIRTSQNLSIQKSFQDQADQQRSAANVGMWVGIGCGVFSAVASGTVMAIQGVTASQQSKIVNQSGAEAAKMHTTALQNTDSPVKTQAHLDSVTAKVGAEIADGVNGTFDSQLKIGQEGDLHQAFTTARNAVTEKQTAYDAAKGELQTANNTLNEKTAAKNDAQARVDALSDKIDAYWEKSQYVKAQGDNADPAKIAEFNQRIGDNFDLTQAHQQLDAAKADLARANTELATAQRDVQIKGDAVTRASAELETAKGNFAQARTDYAKAVRGVASQYEADYQTAVDRLSNPPEGMTKAECQAEVKTAKAKLEMAYAKEAKLLSEEGVMTVSEQKDLVIDARSRLDVTMDRAYKRMDVKALDQRMTKLVGIGNINQAVGGVLQTMAQQLSAIKSSEATRQQAETTKQEEMLDQTKDLFSKAQDLVNQAVQLYAAVIQAENQSMRDAIQA